MSVPLPRGLPARLAAVLLCATPAPARDVLPLVGVERSLTLEPGTPLRVEVALPAPPEKPDLVPESWYAVVSIDLLGVVDGEGARLTLALLDEAGEKRVLRAEQRVTEPFAERPPDPEPVPPADVPAELVAAPRLWLRIPPEELAKRAGGELQLVLEARGASLVTGSLRVERFHEQPTRSLLGKANGKNGPDLLGSGMLGFTGLTEHLSTSFSILDVRAGGPAARAGLVAGDLVVAIDGRPLPSSSLAPGWEWFYRSNEAALGRAIQATLEAGRRTLTLDVLRARGLKTLDLKLPLKPALMGSLEEGFPLRGKLAARLRDDLLAWTVEHQTPNGGWPGTDAVNPALGGLALLGTRDRAHAAAIRRCFDYLLARNPHPREMGGLAYWTVAYQGIFFAEYYLAGGDERALEWMREASDWLPGTTHECKWGMQAFGHGPDGLPYGEKSLMAPTAHLLVYDALARKCGVESRIWEHVREYVVHSWSDPAQGGHGAMGYNASYKDKGEFWSRSGLCALAAALRGENGAMRQGLCLFMQEHHPWMLNSHAYGEPGAALGLLSLAVAHPPALEEILPRWRWRFLNAWQPGYGLRYSTPHMGAPYMGAESVVNLAYAVFCAVENRGLVIAGGEPERWLR